MLSWKKETPKFDSWHEKVLAMIMLPLYLFQMLMFQQTHGSTTLYLGNQIPHSTWSAFRLSRRHSGLMSAPRKPDSQACKSDSSCTNYWWVSHSSGTTTGLWQEYAEQLPSRSQLGMDLARFGKLRADHSFCAMAKAPIFRTLHRFIPVSSWKEAEAWHRSGTNLSLWDRSFGHTDIQWSTVVEWASWEATHWSCQKVCRLSFLQYTFHTLNRYIENDDTASLKRLLPATS